MEREVHLLYGARNKESAIFDSELKAFAKTYPNFTYTLILSDKDATGGDRSGFIDANCISEVVKDLSKTTFYLCGPQVMTDFCLRLCTLSMSVLAISAARCLAHAKTFKTNRVFLKN